MAFTEFHVLAVSRYHYRGSAPVLCQWLFLFLYPVVCRHHEEQKASVTVSYQASQTSWGWAWRKWWGCLQKTCP